LGRPVCRQGGRRCADPAATLDVNGTIKARTGYVSPNGSTGVTDTAAGMPTGLTVKQGLVTAVTTTAPVANGTYTVGAPLTPGGQPGRLTITNGIITAIQEAI
jgi:hypothetical protein